MDSGSCYVLLVIVGIGFAQIKSSTITGTVTDQNGAVVADATITITNTNTGVTTGAKSNADGVYTVPYLEQGLYTVTVRAAVDSRPSKKDRHYAHFRRQGGR